MFKDRSTGRVLKRCPEDATRILQAVVRHIPDPLHSDRQYELMLDTAIPVCLEHSMEAPKRLIVKERGVL
jgi:hypothetical protein